MSATILIVDDDENTRQHLSLFLTSRGYEAIAVATLAEARQQIQRGTADIILLDVQLPDGYGPVLLDETAHIPNRPPVIMITGFGDIEMAVDSMRRGAIDFLQKPIKLIQLGESIVRAWEYVSMRRELAHLRQARNQDVDLIIGDNPVMHKLQAKVERVASTSVSVLITGATGTGKEVLAKSIHKAGPRAGKPFVDINCASIPSTVLESELFGYEPGAFTGAEKRKHGLIEIADGGILFLDEISSMPPEMQGTLLRVLEERSFRRLGGTNLIKVDIQVLAASNRDLKQMIAEGKFRSDLYYRLKVVDLDIPPLKERKDIIPELVGMFIRKANQSQGSNILDVTPLAMEALLAYDWPGNVRELRNVIDGSVLFCDEKYLDISDLPAEVARARLDITVGQI